jgi:hypothetical protein
MISCIRVVISYVISYDMKVLDIVTRYMPGAIIRGTLKAPNSQLVTPISIKLQRPDGCD